MERVSQVSADVVIQQNNDPTRVTQEAADVVLQPTGAHSRLSQENLDVVLQPASNARLTQAFLEVAFQAPSGQHGVWLGATSASTATSLRMKVIHTLLVVGSTIIAALATLHGKGYTALLSVISQVKAALATWLVSPYAATVLADQPTLYYRLDDSGPTAIDRGVYNQNFTWVGTPTYQAPGAILDGDSAVTLAGAPYGQLPHSSLYTPTGSFSCEAWIKTTAPTAENTIISKFQQGGTYPGFIFSVNTAGQPAGHLNLYLGNIWYNSSTAVNDNLWHHVVAVYDSVAATLSFYRDGTPDGVIGNPVVSLVNSQVLRIASRYDLSSFFNGSLDELALYMHPLTAAQVLAHYQAGRLAHLVLQVASNVRSWWQVAGVASTYLFDLLAASPVGVIASRLVGYKNVVLTDHPVAYYRLDEANGPAAVDSSGNGNNGTYSGTGVGFQATGAVAGDSAADFTGTGGVALPSGWANFTNGLSIEFWLNYSGAPTSNPRLFEASTDNTTGQGNAIAIYIAQGTANLSFYTGGTVTWTGAAPTGGYHHYVISQAPSGTVSLYRDGALVTGGSGTTGLPANITRPYATLAEGSYGLDHLSGVLDEVAIYDHDLTASQALTHYQASTNSVYGGAVLLQSVATTVGNAVSTVATNIYRRYQQALATLSSVGATLATLQSGLHLTVLSVLAPTVGTLGTALRRFYTQLLQAAGISLSTLQVRRVVGLLLSVVAFSSSTVQTVKKFRYTQLLVTVTASAPAILLQRFYHLLLQATPGSVLSVPMTFYRRYPQALLASVGSTLAIAFRYTWAWALTAVSATLGTAGTSLYRRYLQTLAGLGATAGALTTTRTLRQVLATVAGSDAGITMVRFYRYLQTLAAQAGHSAGVFTGFGYRLTVLAVSRSTGAIRIAMTRSQALLAQAVGRLVIVTNHSVLLNQALAAVVTFAGAIVRTRAITLLAQSAVVVTLRRLLSLSLVLVATSVTQAFRFFQQIRQQTYPWSGLPPLVGIGSPGPYFAIDGNDSFKQPDHFRIIPRPLFGISIRRRPLYSGWPSQEWSWADLSTTEFSQLMTCWSTGGPWFTIRWMGADGGLHTARAHMHEPVVSNRANLRLFSVTVSFTEVQPATTETAPAWAALAWNPPPAVVVNANHLIRTIGVGDNGILVYDNQANPVWSWSLHHPELPGLYMTAVDPHDPTKKTMLATRYGPDPSWPRTGADFRSAGSIWRTTDLQTWFPTALANTPLMQEPSGFPINGFGYMAPVYDPATPGRVLCLSYFYSDELYQDTPDYIYYLLVCESLNSGASWTIQTSMQFRRGNIDEGFHPTSPHWATSPDGKYFVCSINDGGAMANLVSRDGGATWGTVPVPTSNYGGAYWFVIDQTAPDTWYAASMAAIGGLLRSTDAGRSWTNYYPASNLPNHDSGSIGENFVSFLLGKDPLGKANDLYYTILGNAAPPGIPGGYTSPTGDMLTWQKNGWNGTYGDDELYSFGHADAWVDPKNPKHLIYLNGTTMSESFNSGASFTTIDTGAQPPFSGQPRTYCLEVLDP